MEDEASSVTAVLEKRRENVWRCPRCGRIFRNHVFESNTPASGPMCNTCCETLEWVEIEVEVEVRRMAEAFPKRGY